MPGLSDSRLRQVLDGDGLALGEHADDAQSRCVGQRLERDEQVWIHGANGTLKFDERQTAVDDAQIRPAPTMAAWQAPAQRNERASDRPASASRRGPAQGRRTGRGDRRDGRPDLDGQPDRVAPAPGAAARRSTSFGSGCARAGVRSIAVHAPYLINLCGANDDFWHKSVDDDGQRAARRSAVRR